MKKTVLVHAFIASGDIKPHHLLKLESDGRVALAGENDTPLGVAEGSAKSGERVDVLLGGITEVKLGATLSAGARLKSDGSGCAIEAAATKSAVGMLLVGGSSGEILPALLRS